MPAFTTNRSPICLGLLYVLMIVTTLIAAPLLAAPAVEPITAPDAVLGPNTPASPGVLTINGDFTFGNGGEFTVEIVGSTSTPPNDLLIVTGSVDLGSNIILTVDTTGYTGGLSNYVIVQAGVSPIAGTFHDLPEGAHTGTTPDFIISYVGGDGNDIMLTESTTAVSLLNFSDDGVLPVVALIVLPVLAVIAMRRKERS